jgi:hypothetical protein
MERGCVGAIMRVTCLFVLAVLLFPANLTIGQSTKGLTVAKGAITNGTLMALQDLQTLQEMTSGGDKGDWVPFLTFNSDVHMAGGFFAEPLRVLRADEIRCAEPWFGRALACKSSAPTVVVAAVVTKPMSVIDRYWLDKFSEDFTKFSRDSTRNGKDADSCKKAADFVRDSERASHEDDSVWAKLRTGYCNEVPDGTYPDLGGKTQSCGVSKEGGS